MAKTSLLTKEVQEKIVESLKVGNFREPSVKYAGISMRTFQNWMRRGKEEEEGIYVDFRSAVIEAEESAEIHAVKTIVDFGNEDPKHLQWWLERKFPDRWGRVNDFMRKLQADIRELQQQMREKM